MKKESDRIIVVLHDDKSSFENKGRFPVQDYEHRSFNLLASDYVYDVVPTKKSDPSAALSNAIALYRPAVYMRGDDWPDFPGKAVVMTAGIPIVLAPYTAGVSTTLIREGVKA